MRVRSLLAAFLLANCFSAAAQKIKPHSEAMELHGVVESIEERSANYDFDGKPDFSVSGNIYSRRYFNRQGFQTVLDIFNADGTMYYKLIYRFDEKGRFTEVESQEHDKKTPKIAVASYLYDEAGNNVEIKTNVGGKLTRLEKIQHDQRGNPVECLISENGNESRGASKKYDEQNNLVEMLEYNYGKPYRRQVISYDAKRRKIEKIITFPGKTETYRTTYAYDQQDRLAAEEDFDEKGKSTRKIVMLYNARGKLSERNVYLEGKLRFADIFSFDERGNQTQWLEYRYDCRHIAEFFDKSPRRYQPPDLWAEPHILADDEKCENPTIRNISQRYFYKYLYDAHGNWTEKIELAQPDDTKPPVPVFIQRRTFTYYPASSAPIQ